MGVGGQKFVAAGVYQNLRPFSKVQSCAAAGRYAERPGDTARLFHCTERAGAYETGRRATDKRWDAAALLAVQGPSMMWSESAPTVSMLRVLGYLAFI